MIHGPKTFQPGPGGEGGWPAAGKVGLGGEAGHAGAVRGCHG